MRHFPRRYLETGSLSRPESLEEGQLVTVVGEISRSEMKPYKDRRTGRQAFRQETVVRTEGPSLAMTFFAFALRARLREGAQLDEGSVMEAMTDMPFES